MDNDLNGPIDEETFATLLDAIKSEYPTWREAYADLARKAPAHAVVGAPLVFYVWLVESGELDTDLLGGDDPADQVYFAVREGLIKIGFSGSPRRRLSSASTLTRTVAGGSLQEAMLQNLFAGSQIWRDDKPEGSSAEWYRPTPLLVRIANAQEALEQDRLRRHWRRSTPSRRMNLVRD